MDKMSILNFWKNHKTFLLLLFVGLLLRLFFIEFQGLSNDELSAWYRTRFPMGPEFWSAGVSQGDMHPAFYQVLLYYWVRLFGDSEFSLRATSLLFFALNLSLVYRIACRFYSKYAGLIISAFYVSLGFLIVNTTTARPYNSGVFFLLLAFYLILLLKEKRSNFGLLNVVWLVLAFFGAMTSHYFAFLSAGLLGAVGLFYVEKESRKLLVAAGVMALGLFGILHLSMTLEQLSQGGLGWLGKPNFFWFLEFTKLLFQNSIWMLLLGFGLIYFVKKGTSQPNSHQGFSIVVALVISIVAYFVSIFYTPILRELVFQFILPFAFFGLVGPMFLEKSDSLNQAIRKYMPLIIMGVFSLHSIFIYKLFEPFHYGEFKRLALHQKALEKEYGKQTITSAFNTNNFDYFNYYLKDSSADEVIKDWASPDAVYALNERAKESDKDFFSYSWTNNYHVPMYLECIRQEFPHIVWHQNYFNSGQYLFSKKGKIISPSIPKKQLLRTLRKGGFFEGKEYINETFVSVKELRNGIFCSDWYFTIEMKGKIRNATSFYFVIEAVDKNGLSLQLNGKPLYYMAYDQQRLNESSELKNMFAAFSFFDDLKDTDQFKIYCWSPEKGAILLQDLKLYAIQ